MGLTDKQKSILQKNGYTDEQIAGMPYEQASAIIGEILASPRDKQANQAPYNKTVKVPEIVTYDKPGFKTAYQPKDVNPFYVSYAKDLAIAMIQAQIEQKKEVNVVEIMDLSIMMVGAARDRLR